MSLSMGRGMTSGRTAVVDSKCRRTQMGLSRDRRRKHREQGRQEVCGCVGMAGKDLAGWNGWG